MNGIQQLFKTHDAFVCRLTAFDSDTIQTLYKKCSDYFELIQGCPAGSAESQSLFTALPDGKDYADKYVLGIFSVLTGRLIGVIDLIRDFPTSSEWTLGLMLLDPEFRALGLGRQVCQSLISWCRLNGATSVRLGVVQDNATAVCFWQKMGFEELERKPFQQYGSKEHTIIVMRHHCNNN